MSKSIKRIISLILSIILAFGVNLIAIAENEKSWKNKIDEKIYEEVTGKDSVVPVYIWLTDVDHDEVIQETENELGYGADDLDIVDEYISDELAVAIRNLSEKEDSSVKDELQKYMKKTEKKRKAEKEKTDKYISKKRSNYKDRYNKKSKNFLDKAKISKEEIIFISQYAPMIIAELTLKQIEKVAKDDSVTDIEMYYELVAETSSTMDEDSIAEAVSTMEELKASTKINIIHDIGLTGSGVKVGVKDSGELDFSVYSTQLPEERFTVFEEDEDNGDDASINETWVVPHVINTLMVGFSECGVAPDTHCYIDCINSFYVTVEQFISKNVSLITMSLSYGYSVTYGVMEKWTDHISSMHNVTFVKSAGNYNETDNPNNNVTRPGLAYNIITVGSINNLYTPSHGDDYLYDYSCYVNGDCCEKPDVVAPANMLGGGTSSSTPFVAGIIALMIELKPSLSAYPQVIKAILLASCHHKAAPETGNVTETMSQGVTDKQGTGVVDAYKAISITGRGNYGVREITGGAVSTEVKFNVPHLYEASGINISIAWLRNTFISASDHNTNTVTAGIEHDLNLNVLSGNTSVGVHPKEHSSTEMVYIPSPVAGTTYTARINKVNSHADIVKVGYAWSFNEEQFQYTGDNEGIYFIKNKKSGKYLNYSSSGGVTQNAFSESFYQQWVVYKRENGSYTINSFVGETGCLDVNNLISGKNYSISLDNSNTADVSITQNSDGSVTILKTKNDIMYQLCILNNVTENNVQAVWKRIDQASDLEATQKWYLEPICYQVGDVNMDGIITASDSRIVLNYSVGNGSLGSSVYTNVLVYLADANSDGQITATDSRLILRFAADLE